MTPNALVHSPGPLYHRLARTPGHWWRSVLGTGFILVGLTFAVGGLSVRPPSNAIAEFGLELLGLGLLVPLVLLAARWVQRRPAGTVSSVAGHLRWRWLGQCLLVALPVILVSFVAMILLAVAMGEPALSEDAHWVGWGQFLGSTLMLVALVPFQAAGEEYLMRGWLMQVVGGFLRRPWTPIAIQAVAFAALHGWGTAWGFSDLVVFGALAGWLTIRTGGLEASIALHATNNLIAMLLAAASGGLTSDATAADLTWPYVLVDVVFLIVYTLLVARVAGRVQLEREAPCGETLIAVEPWELDHLLGPEAGMREVMADRRASEGL